MQLRVCWVVEFSFFELKFIYSEKATKFCEISTLLLSYVVPVKSKVEISQNFVSFSEHMNKIDLKITRHCASWGLSFFYESTAPPFYAKLFRISNFLANDYDKESINRVYGKMLLTFKLSISKATLHVQGRWNRGEGDTVC